MILKVVGLCRGVWRINKQLIYKYSNENASNYIFDEIKNHNLRFDTSNWNIGMYFFYPTVYKLKGKNMYQISNKSTLISICFINKSLQDAIAWQNRKSISLKFKEIKYLIGAPPLSGLQTIVEVPRHISGGEISKTLKIKDIPNSQKALFTLTEQTDYSQKQTISKRGEREKNWSIETEMLYSQYRIMYKLLEYSLFDLSGCRLMMEMQKREQLAGDRKGMKNKEIESLFRDL